jgi:hypothetical protein
MPRMMLELLTSWGASFGYGPAKEIWWLAPLNLMWCVWRERNVRNFEDVETSMVELRKRLLNTLYIWIASQHSLNVFMQIFLIYFMFVPIWTLLYTSCVLRLHPSVLY